MSRPRTSGGDGDRSLLDLMRSDVEASVHPNFRLYGTGQFWVRAIAKLLVSPNLRAVVSFRLAHALAERGLMPLALWLRARALRRSGAEIHPRATIGPGLYLVHSSGVVIGPNTVIGARARLHQGVTVGEPQHLGGGCWTGARIGDDVIIGSHAVLLGDIAIGDRAVVGANAVVTHDVPAGAVVAGVPARALPASGARDPAAGP